MSELQMGTPQAMGVLRRAGQTLRFLEHLELAARTVQEKESQLEGLDQALLEKRAELAKLQNILVARNDEIAMEREHLERKWQETQREYAEQQETLSGQWQEKQQATQRAMGEEDRLYLDQCREHEARLKALQATIEEREGYLQGLQRRIGELRADFEAIRA